MTSRFRTASMAFALATFLSTTLLASAAMASGSHTGGHDNETIGKHGASSFYQKAYWCEHAVDASKWLAKQSNRTL